MSDYPAITGIAAMFGWMFWFLGFSGLGERFNPNSDAQSWQSIIALVSLGAASLYPQAYFHTDGGKTLETADMGWAIAFYSVFAAGGFLSGYGLFRLWTRLRHGREALALVDANKSKRRRTVDPDFFELHHGPKAEDLRMQRAKALGEQFEADASKSKN